MKHQLIILAIGLFSLTAHCVGKKPAHEPQQEEEIAIEYQVPVLDFEKHNFKKINRNKAYLHEIQFIEEKEKHMVREIAEALGVPAKAVMEALSLEKDNARIAIAKKRLATVWKGLVEDPKRKAYVTRKMKSAVKYKNLLKMRDADVNLINQAKAAEDLETLKAAIDEVISGISEAAQKYYK